MEKIEITVSKEFVEKYRNYKIDLINGGKIDIDYEIFSRVVEDSSATMREVLSVASESNTDSLTISTSGGVYQNVQAVAVDDDGDLFGWDDLL